MIKKNQTIKGITFANLSYGAESHVQLGDIKLTLQQSELYLNANNYKSVVFIGGRGAGKSFLGKKFLEDALSFGSTILGITVTCDTDYEDLYRKYPKYRKNIPFEHLRGFSHDTILHVVEPFTSVYKYSNEFERYERFFVEYTVPQLDLNNELHRWFIDLVSKDSTLTVIAPTITNRENLSPNWLSQHVNPLTVNIQKLFLEDWMPQN